MLLKEFTGIPRISWALLALVSVSACSTPEIKQNTPSKISAPEYIQVPHPAGFDIADVTILFSNPAAPSLENLKDCDVEFRNQKEQGLNLIRQDPVHYHWCFYQKLSELEAFLKKEPYIEERQKQVMDTYEFLVPVARHFQTQYKDSRYLRWAIRYYRQVSPVIFFEKLDQSPEMTQELVESSHPFGLWREPSAIPSAIPSSSFSSQSD